MGDDTGLFGLTKEKLTVTERVMLFDEREAILAKIVYYGFIISVGSLFALFLYFPYTSDYARLSLIYSIVVQILMFFTFSIILLAGTEVFVTIRYRKRYKKLKEETDTIIKL